MVLDSRYLMSNGVKVEGLDQIKQALERKLGRAAMLTATKEFSTETGIKGREVVRSAEKSFARSGLTVKQTTYRVQRGIVGGYSVTIGWTGSRKALMHLNELGYTKTSKGGYRRIRPAGFKKVHGSRGLVASKAMVVAREVLKRRLNQ